MYRSRNNWSLSTLIGIYQLSGGTSERTSEVLTVGLFDTFAVQLAHSAEVGSPKMRVEFEGSADGTNFSVVKRLDDIIASTEKRVVLEHPTKHIRVKLTITSGTSVAVTYVTAEAIT
ncbi:hypothetical protein HUU59_10930 [bacterium]|nr:hypothetical protein [bacterium]